MHCGIPPNFRLLHISRREPLHYCCSRKTATPASYIWSRRKRSSSFPPLRRLPLPGRVYGRDAFDAGNVYCTVVPPSGVRSASVSTLLLPQITCPPPPPLYFRTFPPPFLGDFRLPSSVKDEQDRILGHATNEKEEEEEVK